MIRRTFTYRRFQIIAALSVGLFLTVASALPGPLEAQTTGTATLTVQVTGARNAKGKIRVALFRDGKGVKDAFLSIAAGDKTCRWLSLQKMPRSIRLLRQKRRVRRCCAWRRKILVSGSGSQGSNGTLSRGWAAGGLEGGGDQRGRAESRTRGRLGVPTASANGNFIDRVRA